MGWNYHQLVLDWMKEKLEGENAWNPFLELT